MDASKGYLLYALGGFSVYEKIEEKIYEIYYDFKKVRI